jgi:hypothetical protein
MQPNICHQLNLTISSSTAGSVEYDILVRHTVDLNLAVRVNLTSLSEQPVIAQIITPDLYNLISRSALVTYLCN